MFLNRSAQAGLGLMLVQALPAWAFSGLRHRKAYRERSFYTMGSVATVCAYGESTAHIDDAINKVIVEFGRLDALLSVFNSSSQISKLNSAAGSGPMRVSREVCDILELSKEFNGKTAGVFDVTVEPLMSLWGFRGRERQSIPTDREISSALEAVGIHHLFVHPKEREVLLDHHGSSVDLGGVAVGYAVDRAVKILCASGIESAFINHAGDAYALGAPDEQPGWIAGIPHPEEPERMVHEVILADQAISTSANNERFVTLDDRRFGHLMDVQSGRPGALVASLTVMAPSAIQADALSTAAFCRPEILANVREVSYFSLELGENGNLSVQEQERR
ncbi:MAG: FAD:protein FMN transferase [Bacteroidota bacterium]